MTVAAAYGLARLSRGATLPWLVVLLVAGEAMHAAYGVPTATQRWWFDVPDGTCEKEEGNE